MCRMTSILLQHATIVQDTYLCYTALKTDVHRIWGERGSNGRGRASADRLLSRYRTATGWFYKYAVPEQPDKQKSAQQKRPPHQVFSYSADHRRSQKDISQTLQKAQEAYKYLCRHSQGCRFYRRYGLSGYGKNRW